MRLSSEQLSDWADTFIQAQLLPEEELTHTHPLWWAVEKFMYMETLDAAEDGWLCVLEILSRTKDERVLGILAAGALYDLISEWGPDFIDRIEAEARRNPEFRVLLLGVWENGDPDVCARVAAAKASHAA